MNKVLSLFLILFFCISKVTFASKEKLYETIIQKSFDNLNPLNCSNQEILYFEMKEINGFRNNEVNKNIDVNFYSKYWMNASHLYLNSVHAEYIVTPKKVFLITVKDSVVTVFDNAKQTQLQIPSINKYITQLANAKITENENGILMLEYVFENTDTLNFESTFIEKHVLSINKSKGELVEIKIQTNDPNAEIYEKNIYIQNRKVFAKKELNGFQNKIFESTHADLIQYFQSIHFKFTNHVKQN
jgi:hypothetical protein